ncbi:alpha/beta fold hydrolase [Streptomyces monticola]|uniref:Alpha/beta fold hydrolase n=1 Tax=Streptomyces monticola TaxID=2666263 RepID=A0ABW2JGD3_9ACTN
MSHVESRDGTTIAYERTGDGPAVVLVGGGLDDGAENAPLAAELSGRFTVYNYARRGRAGSGDTPPYALERETEDLAALIGAAGGTAHVYGVSTGGALVLEAAAAGVTGMDRIGVYEVPYSLAEQWPRQWREYVAAVRGLLADGRRDDALVCFMRLAGSPEEEIEAARNSPYWPGMVALAHTLAYDAACLGDGRPPRDRLAVITRPALVITGGVHPPGSPDWMLALAGAADAIAECVPHARRVRLEGQTHVADPKVIAPLLTEFFTA